MVKGFRNGEGKQFVQELEAGGISQKLLIGCGCGMKRLKLAAHTEFVEVSLKFNVQLLR